MTFDPAPAAAGDAASEEAASGELDAVEFVDEPPPQAQREAASSVAAAIERTEFTVKLTSAPLMRACVPGALRRPPLNRRRRGRGAARRRPVRAQSRRATVPRARTRLRTAELAPVLRRPLESRRPEVAFGGRYAVYPASQENYAGRASEARPRLGRRLGKKGTRSASRASVRRPIGVLPAGKGIPHRCS